MAVRIKIRLREVAPRDGFQSVKNYIAVEKKLKIIEAIARTGISDIEATSFVSAKAIPQLQDAAEILRRVPRGAIRYAAMVPNRLGAQNAVAAGADELVVVISASEEHNQANIRRSIRQSLADLDDIFSLAGSHGVPVNGAIAVSFGCPYQGEVSEKQVLSIAEAYISRGAFRVILADTTGMAVPNQVQAMVHRFQREFPETDFSLHFHNNRGTAMANLYAALLAGARTFDTALGGIGGCPNVPQAAGNLPTEDVAYMLEELGADTGIELSETIEAARRLEAVLGYPLPGQVMKSGPRYPQKTRIIRG